MSPMDVVDRAFRELSSRSRPLRVYGCELATGLPHRLMTMGQVKRVVLARQTPFEVRHAVWQQVVARARAEGGDWSVVLLGLGLPMLRRVGAQLARRWDGEPDELDAQILAGFLVAAYGIDTAGGRIAYRLRWAAYRAGRVLTETQRSEQVLRRGGYASTVPPAPWGHPDLVLVAAVRAGVITATEADLIFSTRLDGVALADAAAALGVTYKAVHQRRRRAERRLVAAVRAGDLPAAGDPVAAPVVARRDRDRVSKSGARTGLQSCPPATARGAGTRTPARPVRRSA